MSKTAMACLKIILRLEIHEIISLLMLVFLAFLYRFGLKDETLANEVVRVAETAGPITTTVLVLMVIFLVVSVFLRRGKVVGHARTLARVMASFLVMLFSFEAVTHFIDARGLPLQDMALQKWDSFLFGGKQPAEWLQPITNHPLTLLLSAVYLSWFAFTYGTIFLMWWFGRRALLEYSATALLTFYIGYGIYILVPAFGPIFTFSYSESMTGLTAMMEDRKLFTPVADAFPSLHTGLSVVMYAVVRKYGGIWFRLYAPVTILIIISTVYLRIHYAVDVAAGTVLSLSCIWICRRWVASWVKLRKSLVVPDFAEFKGNRRGAA